MKDPCVLVKGSWADDFKIQVSVPLTQDISAVRAEDERAVRASQEKLAILRREAAEKELVRMGCKQREFLGAVPLRRFFALQRQLGKEELTGDRERILTDLGLIQKPR